jgi:nitrous oxide reductase
MRDRLRNASSETDEDARTTPARRRFLQVAAGTIALGIAGCSGSSGGGGAGGGSSKTAKSKVSYQDHPNNGERCSECKFFISSGDGANAGKCQKVKGKIANDGWCSLFVEG